MQIAPLLLSLYIPKTSWVVLAYSKEMFHQEIKKEQKSMKELENSKWTIMPSDQKRKLLGHWLILQDDTWTNNFY